MNKMSRWHLNQVNRVLYRLCLSYQTVVTNTFSCQWYVMFTACGHGSYQHPQPVCHRGIAGSIKSISIKARNLEKFLDDTREHVLFPCMSSSFGCSPHQQI